MIKMLVKHKEAKMEAGGVARDFYITDEIEGDGERLNWDTHRYEKVESTTSQRYFVENLKGLKAGDRVNLYINSMGGSVKEALGIYSALSRCPATVYAYIDGFAASAASVIAMAAEKVIMPRNTAMMIHNATWWDYGNPAQLRKSADDLEVINMAAIQSYIMHAGDKLPADELKRMLDAETWLTAEQCVEYGLADEHSDTDVDVKESAAQFQAASQTVKGPEARMFVAVPSFLQGHVQSKAEPQQPQKQEEQAGEPAKTSSIYMLLESMTKMEE